MPVTSGFFPPKRSEGKGLRFLPDGQQISNSQLDAWGIAPSSNVNFDNMKQSSHYREKRREAIQLLQEIFHWKGCYLIHFIANYFLPGMVLHPQLMSTLDVIDVQYWGITSYVPHIVDYLDSNFIKMAG
jgi:hypothetical protein